MTVKASKMLTESTKQIIIHPMESITKDLIKINSKGLSKEYKIKLQIKYRSPSQNKALYETVYFYKYKGDENLVIINSDAK